MWCAEEIALALDGVVDGLLEAAGIDQPPVDALFLAEQLGIVVALDEQQSSRARCVRFAHPRARTPRAAILLQPDPRRERRQWAVAHEIGEQAACQVFTRLGASPCDFPPNARETIANQLAGRLLLPSRWFTADAAERHWDLPLLKARYATASHELIARRMLECGPPVVISIIDGERISFRRSNLPGQTPPLSAAERACWQAIRQTGSPQMAMPQTQRRGGHSVQGWPIHEPGWQREILRAEIPSAEWNEGFGDSHEDFSDDARDDALDISPAFSLE